MTLKELNIGGEYLNYVTPDMINAFKEGTLDIKSLLPLAIKFFANKKPPIYLLIEVNRRRVEIFIVLVYNMISLSSIVPMTRASEYL